MNDPYRITESPDGAAGAPRSVLRPLLWLGLIVSAAANMALSTVVGNPLVSSVFGLVALICAIALTVHHYRTRAR